MLSDCFGRLGRIYDFCHFSPVFFHLVSSIFRFQVPENIIKHSVLNRFAFRFSTGPSGRCHYKSHLRDELLGMRWAAQIHGSIGSGSFFGSLAFGGKGV